MKIFFSFGHDDNTWPVKKIKDELKKRHPDYDIWFDRETINLKDPWRRSIYDGITKADAVVAWIPKHSVRNPSVCLDELRIAAREQNCDIASILLESPEGVTPPLSISQIQYLDMSN